MKKLLLVLFLSIAISVNSFSIYAEDLTKQETRATWISTVYNIDWPKTANQQQELQSDYDLLKSTGINTVYFQVRSMGDAMYPTSYAPWSSFLTKTLGKDPGYDPLAFALEEAKKRDLEFHAWFNPFRISDKLDFNKNNYLAKLPEGNVLKQNPDWIIKVKKYSFINPGIPEARQYVIDTILDVVNRYDIDGVHLDDYFYPYDGITTEDNAQYTLYANGMPKEDWRRENINSFIRDLNSAIKVVKPNVKFGVSPFGIWKNNINEGGSGTNGSESYSKQYVDSLKWVKNNWIDYIVPQIYWNMGHKLADYTTLVKWWDNAVEGTNVDLIIGQASYKIESDFKNSDEIINQIYLNRSLKNVSGNSLFSFKDISKNILGLTDKLKTVYN